MRRIVGEIIDGIYCPVCRDLVVIAERKEDAAYRCRQCHTVFSIKKRGKGRKKPGGRE
jgi:hypothetical protein